MANQVAIIMGSDSDWPVMEGCYKQLKEFGINALVEVLSAHRTPELLADFVRSADQRGVRVFIAAAAMAAALPGSVAALTHLPVIGVPLSSGDLKGLDSLLSIVQMPPGVPVATVAIGAAGAKNAALLAVQILALSDPKLTEALRKFKVDQATAVERKNKDLKERIVG